MKLVDKIGRMLASVTKPLNGYGAFLVFMFVLGLVAVYAVVPAKRGQHAYALASEELLADVCLLCLMLWVMPRKVGLWVKRAMYVAAYLVVLVDVYCFVKFDTTITPTMLLLVGETNSDEAAEFVESYMTFGIVFSRVGRVLLVMLVHVLWAVAYYRVNRLTRGRADKGTCVQADGLADVQAGSEARRSVPENLQERLMPLSARLPVPCLLQDRGSVLPCLPLSFTAL